MSKKSSSIAGILQDKLNYQAIEFGQRGIIPNSCATIIDNLYGDCKDHSVVAYQLGRALGLEVYLVLVNANRDFFPELPSLDQFDHMIVAFEDEGKLRFLDGTNKFS